MKLDRNINENGEGKYALLNLRTNRIEWGIAGHSDEFFVIKLKDRNARAALLAYADSAKSTDPEWADQVRKLADFAGPNSPWCKEPD